MADLLACIASPPKTKQPWPAWHVARDSMRVSIVDYMLNDARENAMYAITDAGTHAKKALECVEYTSRVFHTQSGKSRQPLIARRLHVSALMCNTKLTNVDYTVK